MSLKIEIYTKDFCGYCELAKQLLARKGLAYEEIHLGHHPERLQEMLHRSQGRRTVPQIFINDEGIGGYTELHQMEVSGELDKKIHSTH